MNIYKSALFPYVQGDSLVGRSVVLTMTTVRDEELVANGGKTDIKPVLRFKETSKGLPLNKTNAKEIGKYFGGDTENWAGKQIELYSEVVQAFGKSHNAVRVRVANGGKRPATAADLDAALTEIEAQAEAANEAVQ